MSLVAAFVAGCGDDKDSSSTASLDAPADGATVAGAVHLEMTAKGVTIETAGEAHAGAGHFHVIADEGCIATGTAIPRDADHVHFGKGQTSGMIYLEPGVHELCLQVGDGVHSALAITDRATITVGATTIDQWCAVIGEVDELFSATDGSDDDFETKRPAYENVRRLMTQLTGAIELVDADVRDDVSAAIEFASALATALSASETLEEAEAAMAPLFEVAVDPIAAAQPWILDTCGIDIDGEQV